MGAHDPRRVRWVRCATHRVRAVADEVMPLVVVARPQGRPWRRTGMEQRCFDEMLGAADLPLCGTCTRLLKLWAEGDSRVGYAAQSWSDFMKHRLGCAGEGVAPAAREQAAAVSELLPVSGARCCRAVRSGVPEMARAVGRKRTRSMRVHQCFYLRSSPAPAERR